MAERGAIWSGMDKDVARRLAFQGLLHDASEAYVGDMISPLKKRMPEYRRIERRVQKAIAERFRLPAKFHPIVHNADKLSRRFERNLESAWGPSQAEARFLEVFAEFKQMSLGDFL